MFFKTNARTLQAMFPSLAIVTDGLDMAPASPSPSPGGLEAITPGRDEKKQLVENASRVSSPSVQSPHPSDSTTTALVSRTSTRSRRGRRDGTPKGGGKPRSVKNIVAWLESSKARGKSPPGSQLSASVSSGSKTSSLLPSAARPASGGAPQIPEFSFQTHLDVEDYSLTLLKYRQYFTETPLGRCLDDEASSSRDEQRNVGLAPKGGFAVDKGESGDHHYHSQRVESKNKGDESLEASAHTPPPHAPKRQNSNLDSTSEKTPNISANTNCENMPGITTTITTTSHDYHDHHDHRHPHPHHYHTSSTQHGPEDGAAFWASVRAALWVTDEEMDEYSARRQAQRSDASALRSPRSPSRPAPSPRLPKSPTAKRLSRSNGGRARRRSAAAAAMAPAQESPRRGLAHGRARGVPWRRRNGSGPPSDQVIDEIDEFLDGEESVATTESLPGMSALYAQDDMPPPLTLQPKHNSHSKSGSLPASMPSRRRVVAGTHRRQQQQQQQQQGAEAAPRRRIPSYIRERYDGITEVPGEGSQERHDFMIMYPDGQRTVWI